MEEQPTALPTNAATGGGSVREQADLVLASDALGRSHTLERLFRFLLACTLDGRTPKELEIADEVFGRSAESIDQDASIRVHIHRLRRKLDEFYRGAGAAQPVRLVIPKADYRLAITLREVAQEHPIAAMVGPSRWRRIAAVAAMVVLAGLIGWWLGSRPTATDSGLEQVRESAMWRPVADNTRRTAIVVGDYYIFGQRDAAGRVVRLVREFDVNSSKDLERLAASDPRRAGTEIDLGLNYLPIGIGNAMRAVTPVLLGNEGGTVPFFVVPASKLSPELVKYTNLVYLGYLSGLGNLREPLFSNSRFAIGGSYDEIIDRQTGKTYVADAPLDRGDDSPGQDYAIVSSFRGVTGNAIVVIAGTRDAGLMQAAEFVTRPEGVAELARAQSGTAGFEALLSIESLENVGLRARLIAVSPRRGEADWSGANGQPFPDSQQASPPDN
jgi:hypothetical protein